MTSQELKSAFINIYGGESESIKTFFCPGRVNLIGEHIDYNGGYVFPAALTIGITALWRPRADDQMVMHSLNIDGTIKVDLNSDLNYSEADDWGNYPKGMLQYYKKQGVKLQGADLLFWSNLPDGAGLSSSAAIEVLMGYIALSTASEKNINKIELAKAAQSVENNYIGVNCGIMDQFAVANGKANNAILLDCATLEYTLVPFDLGDYSLVIMNTNKRRELADSKYNERRGECDQALAILNTKYNFKDLCSATIESIDELITDLTIKKRALHVVKENQRVLKSIEILKQGDIPGFGKLLNASHDSLKDDYEVTGLELDSIVSEARNTKGCLGARMTGAGFGGCAIALVQNSEIDNFKKAVAQNYAVTTTLHPTFYTSAIGDGVKML